MQNCLFSGIVGITSINPYIGHAMEDRNIRNQILQVLFSVKNRRVFFLDWIVSKIYLKPRVIFKKKLLA